MIPEDDAEERRAQRNSSLRSLFFRVVTVRVTSVTIQILIRCHSIFYRDAGTLIRLNPNWDWTLGYFMESVGFRFTDVTAIEEIDIGSHSMVH